MRKGHYAKSFYQQKIGDSEDNKIIYDVEIFVSELDRYTNGESKIKLEYLEIIPAVSANNNIKFDYGHANEFVKGCFNSIKNTSEITWLESEASIKEMRKDKLAQLKKAIKGF